MDPSALKAALNQLLSKGEAAKDNKLRAMADDKKGAPKSPDLCPMCKVPLIDGGKCPKCGYSKPEEGLGSEGGSEDSGEGLAGLLEQAGE